MSDLSTLRNRLRDHPECIEIDILGEKRPFLLTMYGLEKARERGIEILPHILDLGNRLASLFTDEDAEDIEIGSQEMADRLRGLLKDEDARTLSVVVWWGLVTFDDDLSLAEVQMMLTPGALVSLVPQVIERVNRFADDEIEEDSSPSREGEEAEGNSPGQKSNGSASEADTPPTNTSLSPSRTQ